MLIPRRVSKGDKLISNLMLITTRPGSERLALIEVIDALFVMDHNLEVYETGASGSFVLRTHIPLERAIERLKSYPTRSIYYIYPLDIVTMPTSLNEIVETVVRLCSKKLPVKASLAVRCRRRSNPFVYNSEKFENFLGEIILRKLPYKRLVINLGNPQYLVMIHLFRELVGIGVIHRKDIIRKRTKWDKNTFTYLSTYSKFK